jgi:hypothetical protein
MSEGVLYDEDAPRRSRREPAYGDNGLRFEPPPRVEELHARRGELALVFAIFAPTLAAYGVAAYGVYRVAHMIL